MSHNRISHVRTSHPARPAAARTRPRGPKKLASLVAAGALSIGVSAGVWFVVNSDNASAAVGSGNFVAAATGQGVRAVAATDVASEPSGTFSVQLVDYTVSQLNAISKAQDYLGISAFSRSGLIDQLKYEGFSESDATVAVDSLHVDWNAQAVKKAKEYLEMTSFSHSGLVEQLEYEGFTSSQAEYGVNAVGL